MNYPKHATRDYWVDELEKRDRFILEVRETENWYGDQVDDPDSLEGLIIGELREALSDLDGRQL